MSIIALLISKPGVVAAGEYAFHGDKLSFRHEGYLPDEHASMASVMCRANTMALRREADLLESFCGPGCGVTPTRGWMVRGPRYTVCVMANVFCFIDNDKGALNEVVRLMRERLADVPSELTY